MRSSGHPRNADKRTRVNAAAYVIFGEMLTDPQEPRPEYLDFMRALADNNGGTFTLTALDEL